MGDDFVGDVPLTKKILAALTTGEQLTMVVGAIAIKFISVSLGKEETVICNYAFSLHFDLMSAYFSYE